MASIAGAAPQFLVSSLPDAIAFYEERLGFTCEFVYAGFYASVARGGAAIHLKCAPRLEVERAHRKAGEHLDAYLSASGIEELHEELVGRGAPIVQPLGERPWGTRDFHVEDPDGYILCFSEVLRQGADTADIDGVLAVESAYDAAWNAGDVNALIRCFAADAVLVNPRGETASGIDQIRDRLGAFVHGEAHGSRHASRIARVSFPTPDVAVVDGEALVTNGANFRTLRHRFTDVLVRQDQRWRIAHVRACPSIEA